MARFLLIPGAGGQAWYWHRVVPELIARGHGAVAVDFPTGDDAAQSGGSAASTRPFRGGTAPGASPSRARWRASRTATCARNNPWANRDAAATSAAVVGWTVRGGPVTSTAPTTALASGSRRAGEAVACARPDDAALCVCDDHPAFHEDLVQQRQHGPSAERHPPAQHSHRRSSKATPR